MSTKSSKPTITGDMLIGDVISRLPESADIMQSYGLHCTSCSVNTFEPLRMGALGHGISEEVVDEMISEINRLATERRRAPEDGIYLSEFAAQKVKEFSAAEGKEGWGLKISAPSNKGREPAYAMDFQEKKCRGEKKFEFHGVSIFLDRESLKNLAGSEIDFIESPYGSGFKINNPNFLGTGGSSGCSSGSGSCSCGGGGSCGCGSSSSCSD